MSSPRLVTLDDLQKYPELRQRGVSVNQHYDFSFLEQHANEIPPVAQKVEYRIPPPPPPPIPIPIPIPKKEELKKPLIPKKMEEAKKKIVTPKKTQEQKKPVLPKKVNSKKAATKKPGKKK